MKKIILITTILALGIQMNAQETPDQIKSKIDALAKQKAEIESQINALNGQLPKPVEPTWKFKGNAAANIGLNVLGNNWSTAYGGNSNLNFQTIGHAEANYKKDRHSWDNAFDGRMGFIKNYDDQGTNINTDIVKSTDLLQLSSKYLFDLRSNNLKVGMGANFISQFTPTYDLKNSSFLISDFLAPGTLDLSPGIQWEPKPYLKVFVAPFAGRMTFVTNDTIILRANENRFGNDVDQRLRTELGAKAEVLFEKELVKNLKLRSRLQLFNNWSRKQDQLDLIESSRANIDVNWQTDFFYALTKNIALTFGFQAMRDDDVRIKDKNTGVLSTNWQIRENFGLGFTWGF